MTVTKPPLLAAKKQPTPIYPLTSTYNGLSHAVQANSTMMSVAYPAQTINTGVLPGGVSQITSVNSVGTPINSSAVQLMPMTAGQFQPMFMMPPVIGAQGMFLQPAFMTPQMMSSHHQSMVTAAPTATVSTAPPRQAVLPIQQHINSHSTMAATRNVSQAVSSIRPMVSSTPLQTVSVRPHLSTTPAVTSTNMVNSTAIWPNLGAVRPALPLGQPSSVTKASAIVTGSPRSTTASTTPKPIAAKPTFVSSPMSKVLKTPPLAPRGVINPVTCQPSTNQVCRPIQPAVTSSIPSAAPNNPNSLPRLAPAAGIRKPEGHILNHVTMKKKKRALAAVNKALLQGNARPSFAPSQIRPLSVHIPPTPQLSFNPPILNERSLLHHQSSSFNKPPPRAQLVSPMPPSKPPSVSQVLVSNPNRPPGSFPRFPISRLPIPSAKSPVVECMDNSDITNNEAPTDRLEQSSTISSPSKEVPPALAGPPPCATVDQELLKSEEVFRSDVNLYNGGDRNYFNILKGKSPSAPFSPRLSETTPKVLPQDQKSSNPSPTEQTASSLPATEITEQSQTSPSGKKQKEQSTKRPATESKDRERRLPSKRTAVVRPEQRRILTHLIDDYVIYESNKPFPVKRGLELVEATLLRQSDSALKYDLSLSSEREDDNDLESEMDDDFDVTCQKVVDQPEVSCQDTDKDCSAHVSPILPTQKEVEIPVSSESLAPKSSVSPVRSVAPTRIVTEEVTPTVSVSPTKTQTTPSVVTPTSYVAPRPSPVQTKSIEPLSTKLPTIPLQTEAAVLPLPEPQIPQSRPETSVPTTSDYLKRDISTWSVADVHHFVLNTPGCQNYATLFKSSEIDGEALLLLSEEHLIQVPISMKVGPALKLSARIEGLKHSVR